MAFPFLGFGAGLRTKHFSYLLEKKPKVDWFEAISENFMVTGGRPLFVLDKIRENCPVVLHGVSLSIGSADPLNREYLKKLKALAARVQPAWVSDHLCWTGVGGRNLHDLLPLPYTEEAVSHVARKVREVQDFLGRPILLENVSSYMEYTHSTMTEWEFLRAVCEEADCFILLDINNIYVSSVNHNFKAMDYLAAVPRERVKQFHLAGHQDKKTHLLDTHDHPVKKDVWELYAYALRRFGPVSTLIEWDDRIPPFPRLEEEVEKARTVFTATMKEARHDSTRINRAADLSAHHLS